MRWRTAEIRAGKAGRPGQKEREREREEPWTSWRTSASDGEAAASLFLSLFRSLSRQRESTFSPSFPRSRAVDDRGPVWGRSPFRSSTYLGFLASAAAEAQWLSPSMQSFFLIKKRSYVRAMLQKRLKRRARERFTKPWSQPNVGS